MNLSLFETEREAKLKRGREHPIFGTDFTKPCSAIVEDVRTQLSRLRGTLSDIEFAYPCWKDRVDSSQWALTTLIVALAHTCDEMVKAEIAWDDRKLGRSLQFSPRGIGCDNVPSCFVSGRPTGLCSNIAAFVASREEGEQIVRWFALPGQETARLDFRQSEPNWIRVKVGCVDSHLPSLNRLYELTSRYGRIRQCDIAEARAVPAL